MHNTITTRFRLASISKTFSAVIIMKLVQEDRLELDDLIDNYFSGLPNHLQSKITICHLLTHSSGLREFWEIPEGEWLWNYDPPPVGKFVRAIFKKSLEFTPGGRYSYQNSNFYVLGLIIEKVNGLSFDDALDKYVLQPAGMTQSGLEYPREIIPQRADGYARTEEGGWRKGSYSALFYAAGGIYSSALDMYLYSRALDKNLLLKPETQQRMLTP